MRLRVWASGHAAARPHLSPCKPGVELLILFEHLRVVLALVFEVGNLQ